MSKPGKNQRRLRRQAKKRRQRRGKLLRDTTILRMSQDSPDLDTFIVSLGTSDITRLLGVYQCSPEEYPGEAWAYRI